jgi:hypothetical protein
MATLEEQGFFRARTPDAPGFNKFEDEISCTFNMYDGERRLWGSLEPRPTVHGIPRGAGPGPDCPDGSWREAYLWLSLELDRFR